MAGGEHDFGPGNNCHTPADNGGVSIQLRLVESPTREAVRRHPDAGIKGAAKSTRTTKGKSTATGRPVRGRTVAAGRGRAVHWADWHLDARTRRVGRAGIAAARAALEQAVPKAS